VLWEAVILVKAINFWLIQGGWLAKPVWRNYYIAIEQQNRILACNIYIL